MKSVYEANIFTEDEIKCIIRALGDRAVILGGESMKYATADNYCLSQQQRWLDEANKVLALADKVATMLLHGEGGVNVQ